MAEQVIVPKLGLTVTEVTIVDWLVADGGSAVGGEPLVTVATDKVEQEIPAPLSGTVRHRVDIDDVVAVGGLLCEIE